MKSKSDRRQQAMAKSRRKNRIIAAVCFLVLAAVIVLFVINIASRDGTRVFVSPAGRITLNIDGTFEARLPHGVVRSGSFEENTADGVTTISFTHNGVTSNGRLFGNSLSVPPEWDDGCGHGLIYTLRR